MKPTISIILFLALPFVIYGGNVPRLFATEVENINTLAKRGTKINNALKLKENGFLGEGAYGFVYEGTMKRGGRTVAIKFVTNDEIESCEREIEMYCYLKAYKNANAEKYGIPVVYYYDRWEDYILIAFTKFDMDFLEVANANDKPTFGTYPLDVLILLRDFVFQSKYLHSCGIRHDDIKPDNIMIRGHRSFLIDFNSSSKMMEDRNLGTLYYAAQRIAQNERRRAIDDWESFLYTLSFIMGNEWFKKSPDFESSSQRVRFEKNVGVEKIIKAFADEVFIDNNGLKAFPDYDKMEQMISSEIKKIQPDNIPKFSWVTATDAEIGPVRKIKNINEPKSIDFNTFIYPPVVHLSAVGKKAIGCFSIKQRQ